MTRHSGMTNGGATGPEAFATTFTYGASTLLGTTPGHASATATDSLGLIYHEFVASADARDATRPGLRGRETKTAYKKTDGTVVDETIRTYGLRRSSRVLDASSGADTTSESDFIELRAVEHWSSESAGKQITHTDYSYDEYGNLVRTAELGDTSTTADDRTTASSMLPNPNIWLVDVPQNTTLYKHAVPTAVETTGSGQPSADGAMSWCAWWYQSFTAPATGVLKLVQPYLYLAPSPPLNGTLNMRVYADSGGAPGTLLGSTSAAAAGVPVGNGSAPTPFDLDVSADGTVAWNAPVRVTNGQLYWIGLQAPVAPYGGDVKWVGTTSNTYTRGSAMARDAAGATCQMPWLGPDQTYQPPMPVDLAMKVNILPDLGDAATPAVAQTQFAYDGWAYGATPIQGLVSQVTRLDSQTPATKEVDLHLYDYSGNRVQTISLYDPATSSSTDARNPRTDWTYDASYRAFATTTAVRAKDLGGGSFLTLSTTRVFDARSGALASRSDPNGATTTYGYDVFYRPTSVRRPGDETGNATQTYDYFYGSAPNRLLITSKDGTVAQDGGLHTIQFYDGLGRLIETKREMADNAASAGRHSVVRRLYTDRGLLQKEFAPWATPAQTSSDFLTKFEPVETESPVQPFTLSEYDPVGRLSRRTGTDAAVTALTYGDGLMSIADALSHKTERYQDGFGRLRMVKEYTGVGTTPSPYTLYATTSYAYNSQGLLTLMTDTANKTATYTYDGLGRRLTQTDPDAGYWTYGYDSLDRLTTSTDAKLQRTDFYYDNASRLTQRVGTPSGGTATTLATYGYDSGGAAAYALGRPTSLSDPSGSTSWEYDSRGRVTHLAQTILGTLYSSYYSHDALDRVTTTTYPDNEAVTITYGSSGLPVALSNGTTTYVSAQSYDALFRPLSRTLGNGVTATLDYYDTSSKTDHDGNTEPQDFRLRSITYASGGSTYQKHEYSYDRAGNVSKWWQTDDQAVLHAWTFSYDDLDRLHTAAATNPAPSNPTTSYEWDYDAQGRLTYSPRGTYTYGDPNHVHAVTQAGSNVYATYDANGAVATRSEWGTSYIHVNDLNGRLSQVTVGSTATTFSYADGGDLVAKSVGGTATLHIAMGGLFEKNPQSGAVTKYYRFGSVLVAMRDSAVHYLGQDHLGSTSLQMSASATVEGVQLRAPYGEPWLATGNLVTDRQYIGGRSFETALGSLEHLGARFYSPVLGRFMSPDPVLPKEPRTLDRYGYAAANPLRMTDKTGRSPDSTQDSADVAAESLTQTCRSRSQCDVDYPALERAEGGSDAFLQSVFDELGMPLNLDDASINAFLTAVTALALFQPDKYLTLNNTVLVVQNATGVLGELVTKIGGVGNTVTFSSTLIVSTIKVAPRSALLAHELGHVMEAQLLGGAAYLKQYLVLQAAAVALCGAEAHVCHPMEIEANLLAGLNWDWNGGFPPDNWIFPFPD